MAKVICISGKAQHGKDTTAEMLTFHLSTMGNHKVLIVHYADLLKFICTKYFGWNGGKDTKGRTLLQYVGTDTIRTQCPDYWVDFVTNFLKLFPDEWDYVIIPDCRFPNEIDGMRNAGFDVTHIRVVRPNFDNGLTEEQRCHPSENALDDFEYDIFLNNDGTLNDLTHKVALMYIKNFGGKI